MLRGAVVANLGVLSSLRFAFVPCFIFDDIEKGPSARCVTNDGGAVSAHGAVRAVERTTGGARADGGAALGRGLR